MTEKKIVSENRDSAKMKSTDGVPPSEVFLPNINVIEWVHELRLPEQLSSAEQKEHAERCLLEHVKRDEMLPFYHQLVQEFHWPLDTDLVERLTQANEKESKALDDALTDAEENFGDTEVKVALLAKANFLCRIGDLDGCITAYEKAREKTVGSGGRLDVLLTLIRIHILSGRQKMAQKILAAAEQDCEKGGDWERRNRLKIFSAILMVQCRKFAQAVQWLLECVAIFSASDLITFKHFIFITVVLSLISLERPLLKSKVLENSKITQVLEDDPILKKLFHSYMQCRYTEFMEALVEISPRLERSLFFQKHARYFVRSARVNAYRQFLQPFSSITIASMASNFGVSEEFLETDVADYIANGKLTCKIDRVSRVIVHESTASTDPWYIKTLKHGDILLEKMQRLSKIIDM